MLLYQGVARCNKGGVLCKMSALNDASVDISPTTRRQNAKCVHLRGTKKGLGIKIVGGRNVHTANKSFGVYIKEIVSGQLADTNGGLCQGDQLLEANGITLVGVSNERAVEILRSCAATDTIELLVARDIVAQNEFKRLSIQHIPVQQNNAAPKMEQFRRQSSGSSDLVSVSETSDSSVQEEDGKAILNDHHKLGHNNDRPLSADSTDKPPPLPTSPPPNEEKTIHELKTTDSTTLPDNCIPSPKYIDEIQKISFPKVKGLGIAVTGGVDTTLPVSIAKIVPGMDAAKDGRMKVRDIIININGILFNKIKAENAQAQLFIAEVKGKQNYLIEFKRPGSIIEDKSMKVMNAAIDIEPTNFTSPSDKNGYQIKNLPEGKCHVNLDLRNVDDSTSDVPINIPATMEEDNSSNHIVHQIQFAKKKGLGLSITGDIGSPHILISNVMAGMDADMDGHIKVGDILVSVNDELFFDITMEKAQTKLLLVDIKTKEHSLFTVKYKSTGNDDDRLKEESKHLSAHPTVNSTKINTTSSKSLRNVEGISMSGEASQSRDAKKKAQKISIPKNKGLGINIGVGKSSSVLVTKIVPGMDVHQDGRMKVGDVLVSVNGISFSKIDPNRAQTQLLIAELKTKHNVIEFQRDYETENESSLNSTPITLIAKAQDNITGINETQKLSSQSSYRKLSVDPQNKFKLDKLIWALEYIGYKVTNEQRKYLTKKLPPDENGKVVYAEFVQLAQTMYSFKLEEICMRLSQALEQKTKSSLLSYSPTHTNVRISSIPSTAVSLSEQHISEEHHSKQNSNTDEFKEQLVQMQKELKAVKEENVSLKNELSNFKLKLHELTSSEITKKLAIKDCELKKKEKLLRRYQVATEKLEKYIEGCHDLLVNSPDLSKLVFHPQGVGEPAIMRGNPVSGNPRPPLYLSQHTKKTGMELAHDAKETLYAVRQIVDASDMLPYGWEEQYGNDGRKYYINHVEQTTSWVHPETRAFSKNKIA